MNVINNKDLIIFTDCGDTIIDEGTEIRNENEVVIKADVIPGADITIKTLSERGYTIAIVADGMHQSFENMFKQHDIKKYFSTCIYSEDVGTEKPHKEMFIAAMEALNLKKEDCKRIVMVGNNLSRDIKGANSMGITSVFLDWTPRYPKVPSDKSEVPDYIISTPLELLDLVEQLNLNLFHKEVANE